MARTLRTALCLLLLFLCGGCAPRQDEGITGSHASVEIPSPVPVPSWEPWQEAYRTVLSDPAKYEKYYAVEKQVPSGQKELLALYMEEFDKGSLPYYFAVSDIDGDGAEELLLGCGENDGIPKLLLNILRYDNKSDQLNDVDGPRTYPLMDSLRFYQSGYFDTQNLAGDLYTECWRLEDVADHYWYGYERCCEDICFWDIDGIEMSLRSYYEMCGDEGLNVQWKKLTEDEVRGIQFPLSTENGP